jgi:hypothetical protein
MRVHKSETEKKPFLCTVILSKMEETLTIVVVFLNKTTPAVIKYLHNTFNQYSVLRTSKSIFCRYLQAVSDY